jgi:hypothetical protein
MRAIHLNAYGNPAQNLRMLEVSALNTQSAGEGSRAYGVCADGLQRSPFSERSLPFKSEATFCHWR